MCISVFNECPVYQTEHFIMRKMKMDDVDGLFKCYNSNPQVAKYYNSDCNENDLFYTNYDDFVKCMFFWESRYIERDFVRFTVIEKSRKKIVGMVEICPSYKYAADGKCMAVLRLDILPEYEHVKTIEELMLTLIEHVYKDFEVYSILMKVPEEAGERRLILKKLQFVSAKEECNISFADYFIRY